MSDPAAAPIPAPASTPASATASLFADPNTPAPAPAPGAPTPAPAPAAPLTPEQQAAADAAKNEPAPLKMPGKDAKPEDWQAFYKQLGKPDTPDAYEVTQPEGDDPANAELVKRMFHEANILPEQAAKLLEFRNKIFTENNAKAAAAQQAAEQALHAKNTAEAKDLQNEWGQAHTANMEMAKRGIAQFVPGEQAQKAELVAAVEGVLGYKGTVKFFQNIGKGLAEGDAAGLTDGPQGGSKKSAADILYPSATK